VEGRADFEDVFERLAPRVLAYALRRTAREQDAEDAAAETFVVAWRRAGKLPAEPERLAYLLGICRRVLANQRRGEQRRVRLCDRLRMYASTPAASSAGSGSGRALDALALLRRDDQEILRLVASSRAGCRRRLTRRAPAVPQEMGPVCRLHLSHPAGCLRAGVVLSRR
jgi:DNA-directed RNA polymerase specialized sigma24 family protein